MRGPGLLFLLLLCGAAPGAAAVIDRIAASIDSNVITESELLREMRLVAFIEGNPFKDTAAIRREALDRMIDRYLIQREMETSRYTVPKIAEVEPLLASLKKERGWTEQEYAKQLRAYRLTDAEVRRHLLWSLTTLRFIEFRFRPGVQVSDAEIVEYYNLEMQGRPGAKPLDAVRDQIEEILTEQRIDGALDRWLGSVRTQIDIRERPEIFQ